MESGNAMKKGGMLQDIHVVKISRSRDCRDVHGERIRLPNMNPTWKYDNTAMLLRLTRIKRIMWTPPPG